MILQPDFFERNTCQVAEDLIGCQLCLVREGQRIQLAIIETEAYRQDDPACHAYVGKTKRNEVLFGPPGCLYIYFIYGCHFCMNFVTESEGVGAAVPLRAAAPVRGESWLRTNRPIPGPAQNLTNGPGKLCQALALNRDVNGQPLAPQSGIWLEQRESEPPIAVGPRIGISKARDLPWRFGWANHAYLSAPFKPDQT